MKVVFLVFMRVNIHWFSENKVNALNFNYVEFDIIRISLISTVQQINDYKLNFSQKHFWKGEYRNKIRFSKSVFFILNLYLHRLQILA